ncbi:MAG: hypothetical protein QNK03_16575 [Myxococcota bacterium]|nr:hypothetical protein [Myxococcota bacterium]
MAAALNAAAAALAWRIAGARRESAESRPRSAPDVSPAGADADAPAGAARLYLVAALGTGFVSLGLELAWTRALGLRMTSSVYSFAIILAAFLVALAAGAWVVARLDRRVGITRASCGALIGLGAVGAWLSIRVLAWLGESAGAASFAGVQARELATAFAVMAVPGLCLGASFPALIRLANRELASLGTDVGRVYLWNTVGAVTGPPLVGLVLLPRLGTTATITLLGAVSLGLGLLLARPRPAHTAALVAAGGALALACWADLRFWNAADGDVLRSYREGLGASVAVVDRKDGTRLLKVGAYRLGDDVAVYPQRRQGLLPLLLHPEPSTALMLGLGTGTSTAGVLGHGGVAVDNLELLPDVVAALPWFEHVNDQLAERAQRDSAVRVLTVDARHFVRATERRYDVVIGDLFVPWRRGEGAMFTVEHFRAVRDVLTQGGLFVQWLPLYQLGEEDLAIIVRTFCEAFPHASAWWLYFNPQSATLGLAGSREPQRIDASAYRARIGQPRRQRFFAENGFDSLGKLAASWIAGRDTLVRWARDAPIESRLRPQTEFGAPHRRLRGTRELVRRNVEVLLGWSEDADGTEAVAGWSDADRDLARRYRTAARHYFQGRLALLFDSSGRGALEQYLAALALAPDWIWIERNVQRTADRAIEAGELDLARRAADALLAQPPSAPAGHYLRARLALAAGDAGRARDELIAALGLRPGHGESAKLLARLR